MEDNNPYEEGSLRHNIRDTTSNWNKWLNKKAPEEVHELLKIPSFIIQGIFDQEKGLLKRSPANPLGLAPGDVVFPALELLDKALIQGPAYLTGIDPGLVRKAWIAKGATKVLKNQFKTTTTPYINPQKKLPFATKQSSITVKPNDATYESIINQSQRIPRFIPNPDKAITAQGRFPKGDNPSLPITDFAAGTILGADGQPYPLLSTGGSDDGLVPKWFFDFEGSQFSNTSDVKGLNKPGEIKTPQQERNWYSKATYQRIKEEVLDQGGTRFDADRLFEKKRDFFEPLIDKKTGQKKGKGIVAAISELNNMFQQWSPGIQVRTEKYTRNGQDMYRYTFKDVDGKRTRWDFEREDIDGIVKSYSKTTFAKDHLSPVKDRSRIGGGYYGADNPGNFEILYQFVNIQKSNTYQLPPELLKEMVVPDSLSEWVNMELYPQNYEGTSVPQRWKENFQKIVLADYYEKVRGLKSVNKRNAVMQKLISKHSTFFKDPKNIQFLEGLEKELGQQVAKNMEEGVAAGNEVPSWLGLLQRPPGGWNSKDPWWNSLPDDAKQRYRWMYEYRDRTITQPYKRPPQGNKMYD